MPTTDELLERIETLEQEQAKLQKKYQVAKEQNEQVLNLFEQFKSGSISRRAFLTSVSAVAGISWLAGSADAAPNWSNASGNSGTESKPLKNVYAQNGTFQSLSTDKIDTSGGYSWQDVTGTRSLNTWYQAPTDRDIEFMVSVQAESNGTEIGLNIYINTSQTDSRKYQANSTVDNGNNVAFSPIRIPAGHYYKVGQFKGGSASLMLFWSELR